MTENVPRDRRRPAKIIEQTDGSDPLGALLRVRLETDLLPTGEVSAVVTKPSNDTSPATQADMWADTARIIPKVRHGLPTDDLIPGGAICWITKYAGKWCVVIPECN